MARCGLPMASPHGLSCGPRAAPGYRWTLNSRDERAPTRSQAGGRTPRHLFNHAHGGWCRGLRKQFLTQPRQTMAQFSVAWELSALVAMPGPRSLSAGYWQSCLPIAPQLPHLCSLSPKDLSRPLSHSGFRPAGRGQASKAGRLTLLHREEHNDPLTSQHWDPP